jgi:hypothetical protein
MSKIMRFYLHALEKRAKEPTSTQRGVGCHMSKGTLCASVYSAWEDNSELISHIVTQVNLSKLVLINVCTDVQGVPFKTQLSIA